MQLLLGDTLEEYRCGRHPSESFVVLIQQLEQVNYAVYNCIHFSRKISDTVSLTSVLCWRCSCWVIYSLVLKRQYVDDKLQVVSPLLCVFAQPKMYLSWLHGSIALKSVECIYLSFTSTRLALLIACCYPSSDYLHVVMGTGIAKQSFTNPTSVNFCF